MFRLAGNDSAGRHKQLIKFRIRVIIQHSDRNGITVLEYRRWMIIHCHRRVVDRCNSNIHRDGVRPAVAVGNLRDEAVINGVVIAVVIGKRGVSITFESPVPDAVAVPCAAGVEYSR